MELGAIAFYAVAAATLAAALGVVITRSVVYSALLLVASLILTGLVYLILLADFLALVQVLIYGGTVSVLLVFALMLTRPEERPVLNHRGWPLAALGAAVLFVILIAQTFATSWPLAADRTAAPAQSTGTTATGSRPSASTSSAFSQAVPGVERVGPEALGTALYGQWGVPIEIASLVLLVALMGSLVIARGTTQATDDEDVPEAPGAVPLALTGGAEGEAH